MCEVMHQASIHYLVHEHSHVSPQLQLQAVSVMCTYVVPQTCCVHVLIYDYTQAYRTLKLFDILVQMQAIHIPVNTNAGV